MGKNKNKINAKKSTSIMNKKYFKGESLEATKKFIKKIESETKEKHKIKVLGETFEVFPSVFSPKYFKDPEFFVEELPINKGETFLEIGCGSGIISIFAILKGASKVVAIDINSKAVENTKHNAKIHGIQNKIKVLQGDVFKPLNDEKFDTIFWNTPWGLVKETNLTQLENALWDTEYKSTTKFIKNANKYLNKNGRLLIGFSSTIGDLNYLQKIIKENNYKAKIIKRTKSKAVDFSANFEIIEARLK